MNLIKTMPGFVLCLCLAVSSHAQQHLSAEERMLFKNTKSKLTVFEKDHLFQQLDITWSASKEQFVDKDDEREAAPYMNVVFFPTDINHDGTEEVFIVLTNPQLFDTAGAEVIFFAKDADGSYQKNTELPAEDLVALSRKHLGYPDMLLPSSGRFFTVWRWTGKKYAFFQRVDGQLLPLGPNEGLEDISKAYQGSIKITAGQKR